MKIKSDSSSIKVLTISMVLFFWCLTKETTVHAAEADLLGLSIGCSNSPQGGFLAWDC